MNHPCVLQPSYTKALRTDGTWRPIALPRICSPQNTAGWSIVCLLRLGVGNEAGSFLWPNFGGPHLARTNRLSSIVPLASIKPIGMKAWNLWQLNPNCLLHHLNLIQRRPHQSSPQSDRLQWCCTLQVPDATRGTRASSLHPQQSWIATFELRYWTQKKTKTSRGPPMGRRRLKGRHGCWLGSPLLHRFS